MIACYGSENSYAVIEGDGRITQKMRMFFIRRGINAFKVF